MRIPKDLPDRHLGEYDRVVKPPRRGIFKNIILTIGLTGVVFWLGVESARRGVFKLERDVQNSSQELEPSTENNVNFSQPGELGAAPIALPLHFPQVEESDLAAVNGAFVPLHAAYSACWPKVTDVPTLLDAELTRSDFERLFGKIKKREVLERGDTQSRLGFLFDTSIFTGGAAGSATEKNGQFSDLQLRAAGRMLHCENALNCECL